MSERPDPGDDARAAPLASLRMLGGFAFTYHGHAMDLVASTQRLVVALALRRAPATRSQLARALHPGVDERRALADLRTTLWRVHRRIPDAVARTGHLVALASSVEVDLRRAEMLVMDVLDPARPPADLDRDDVLLLCADLLPGWDDEWVAAYAARWTEVRAHALDAITDRLRHAGADAPTVRALVDAARVDLNGEAALTLVRGLSGRAPEPGAVKAARSPLTPREREIAALVAAGSTNREIAQRLVVSPRTVDAHVEHIRTKLGLRSRAGIAAWVAAAGE